MALSTLPRHILTQGTAIRSLMRNLGGSIGISRPGRDPGREHADRAFAPGRASAARQPADPGAVSAGAVQPQHARAAWRALNAEVTRQAAMVAYIDDFKLMMGAALAVLAAVAADPQPPPRFRPAAPRRPRRRPGRRRRLNPTARVRLPGAPLPSCRNRQLGVARRAG